MDLVRTNDIESEYLAPPAVLDVQLRGAARPFPVAHTRKMACRGVNGNGLLKHLVEMVTIQLGDLVQGVDGERGLNEPAGDAKVILGEPNRRQLIESVDMIPFEIQRAGQATLRLRVSFLFPKLPGNGERLLAPLGIPARLCRELLPLSSMRWKSRGVEASLGARERTWASSIHPANSCPLSMAASAR